MGISFNGKGVLDRFSLRVESGDFLAVIGPSGSGKTTLLRIINGLERPDCGSVSVLGNELTYTNNHDLETRRKMVLVTQKPVPFNDTVRENISYPLRLRDQENIQERVDEILATTNLEELAHKKGWELSGGELQRLAFARATVFRPDILLLDEFTAHLDPYNIGLLEDGVRDYMERYGATVIMVTHNLFQAKRISDQAAFLLDGRIVEKGPTSEIFNEPGDERTAAFVRGDMVF